MFSPCSAKRRASEKDLPVLQEEETMKTNSHYDDTKDLLKLLNNETIEKSTNFKPDSELSKYDLNDFPLF